MTDLYRMKPYPAVKPEQSGYYMTYYYNASRDHNFYKALWYNLGEDYRDWETDRKSVV